jgi:hypothetical protein
MSRTRCTGRRDHSVAIQQKNWIALGTTTMRLAAEKNASDSCGSPVVNMWWTHSAKLMKPMPIVATTIHV